MTAPTHLAPRRTAASHHRTEQATAAVRLRLLTRLRTITGRDVTEVRLTSHGPGRPSFWCVLALGTDRQEVPLPKGGAQQIAHHMRLAFPAARWDRAQDYDVTTGVLAEHITVLPDCLALDGMP
ncbi:hypothetical protein [Streptomyces sp. NPDC088182]|uniref:hypothetical protein n=1 Tax=Streptomyces sp. NPDC088182 TaxID=3365838 RepID=UPI0037F40501